MDQMQAFENKGRKQAEVLWNVRFRTTLSARKRRAVQWIEPCERELNRKTMGCTVFVRITACCLQFRSIHLQKRGAGHVRSAGRKGPDEDCLQFSYQGGTSALDISCVII